MLSLNLLLAYLLVINVITFMVFGVDKRRAEQDAWRVKESTLLGLCVMGGALGGFLGMGFFHHKTRKPKFQFGVPVAFILDVVVIVWLFHAGVVAF